MTIKNMLNIERPREKLLMYGRESLSDTELIAILLRNGVPNKSALQLAEDVVSYDQAGLKFLTRCVPEELAQIYGIGCAKACQIIAGIELGKRANARLSEKRLCVNNPNAVAAHFMEGMKHYTKEYFKVLMLNTKIEIIAEETVAIGNLDSTVIHPREIFNKAVKNSSASIILVHNHPSGNPVPSTEDINITNRLIEAGNILGIKVLDHLVIGNGVYISLKEENLCNF